MKQDESTNFGLYIKNLFQKKMHLFSISFTLILFSSFVILYLIPSPIQTIAGTGQILLPSLKTGFNSSKVIILAFDDSPKSQFTLAKPILDKYNYKGNFFTVCTYVIQGSTGADKSRMTWQDIQTLQQQGH